MPPAAKIASPSGSEVGIKILARKLSYGAQCRRKITPTPEIERISEIQTLVVHANPMILNISDGQVIYTHCARIIRPPMPEFT